MTKLTRRQRAMFAHLTDATLEAQWQALDTRPECRVKTGRNRGQLKLRFIKLADLYRMELWCRRDQRMMENV